MTTYNFLLWPLATFGAWSNGDPALGDVGFAWPVTVQPLWPPEYAEDSKMDRIGIVPERDMIIVELHPDEYEALRALQDACGHSSSFDEARSRLTGSSPNIALWLVAVRAFIFNLEKLTRARESLDEVIKALSGEAMPRPEGVPSIWNGGSK